MSDKVLIERELLERIVNAPSLTDEGEAIDKLRALLTAQPQSSAAQSAPAGEREAFEAWWVSRPHRKVPSKYENGDYVAPSVHSAWEVWQARAAWQRTQSAGVPDGWRLVPVSERLPEDHSYVIVIQEGLSMVGWYATRDEVWRSASMVPLNPTHWMPIPRAQELLAAALAQPAAQDQGEVQRLREALERIADDYIPASQEEAAIALEEMRNELKLVLAETALAASTGQEV